MIDPIAGNEGVITAVEQVATLSTLIVGDLHAASIDGNLTEFTLTGYAPLEFSTAVPTTGQTGLMTLNNAPGLPQATSLDDPNLLVLPSGSVPQAAYITNNSTTITSTGANAANVSLGLSMIGGALTAIPPIFTLNVDQLLTTASLNIGVANFGANNNGGPGGVNQGIAARGWALGHVPNTSLGGPGFSGYGVAGVGGVSRAEVPTVVTIAIFSQTLITGDLKVRLTCFMVPDPGT